MPVYAQQPLDVSPNTGEIGLRLAALNKTVQGNSLGTDASPAGKNGTPAGNPSRLPVGVRLDGTDDTIDFGDLGDIQQVSLLINPSTTTEQVILVDAGNYIHIVAGTVTYVGLTASVTYVNAVATTTIAAGEWSYLVCQFTQIDADNFELGVDGAANFGAMDVKDLRAIDAAWSASRVSWECQQAIPDPDLALWTMGDAVDLSRYSRVLTKHNGIGIGHQMSLDGPTSQYIITPAIELTAGASVSLWFNPSAVGTAVLFNDVPDLNRRIVILLEAAGEIRAGYWTGAVYRSRSGTTYYANRWQHVFCTWDADETFRMWLNAAELTGTTDPSSGNGISLRLGSSTGGTSYYTGLMRDVRVWIADKGPDYTKIIYEATRNQY